MNLPKYYLDYLNTVNSFKDFFHLKSYLFDSSSDLEVQKMLNFEKSVLVLSGIEIENFPLDEIDLLELETYIDSKLNSDNQYLNLLYGMANIHIKIKLKKYSEPLQKLLDDWFEQLKTCKNLSSLEDNANYITISLTTYLSIAKKISGKRFEGSLSNVADFIMSFEQNNVNAFTNFCDEKLLSYFTKNDKEKIIHYFFTSLVNEIGNLSDEEKAEIFRTNRYFMLFFDKAINYSNQQELEILQHRLTDFFIGNTFKFTINNESVSYLEKFDVLQQILKLASFHKESNAIKNYTLLNIIDVSKGLHKYMTSKVETFEQPLSEEHKSSLNKKIEIYKKYKASDCLSNISNEFFNIAKTTYKKQDNEFHLSMIASQVMLDESGLLKGFVSGDDDSRCFDKVKQQISLYIQLKLPAYEVTSQKPEFQSFLSNIELFNTADDEHIRKALKDFVEEDYYGFICRSIPLIEKKLRLILRELGEADIKQNDIGGFDFRPMNAFMSSDVVAETFSEPVRFMFKAIFDDRRGFNLRNKVAHGIIQADEITLFHGLLVLFTVVYLSNVSFEP